MTSPRLATLLPLVQRTQALGLGPMDLVRAGIATDMTSPYRWMGEDPPIRIRASTADRWDEWLRGMEPTTPTPTPPTLEERVKELERRVQVLEVSHD